MEKFKKDLIRLITFSPTNVCNSLRTRNQATTDSPVSDRHCTLQAVGG